MIDSMHVAEATKPERLLAMLERVVQKLNPTPGDPLVPPAPKSTAPKREAGTVALHLTARYLTRQGSDLVPIQPVLGTERSSQWASLPSEDWIVFRQAEWKKLLPAGGVRGEASWDWDKDVAAKLLNHFNPPTENTDLATNRIDHQVLKATVVSIRDGVVRARIEGKLTMKHPFYHRDTTETVEASIVGFMDFEAGQPKIHFLRLVTVQATYGNKGQTQPFGVAVRSVP